MTIYTVHGPLGSPEKQILAIYTLFMLFVVVLKIFFPSSFLVKGFKFRPILGAYCGEGGRVSMPHTYIHKYIYCDILF